MSDISIQAAEPQETQLNAAPTRPTIDQLPEAVRRKQEELRNETAKAKATAKKTQEELASYRQAVESALQVDGASSSDIAAKIQELLDEKRRNEELEQKLKETAASVEANLKLTYQQEIEELKKANQALAEANAETKRLTSLRLAFIGQTGQDFTRFQRLFELDFSATYDEKGELTEIRKLDGTPIYVPGEPSKPATPDQVFTEIRKGTFGPTYVTLFQVPYNSSRNANIPQGITSRKGVVVAQKSVNGIPVIGAAEVEAIKENRYVRS